MLYGHPTAGDVTKIDAADVPDHDILAAGFPCQAFSVAGKRLGFEDTRGTLFFEVARIAAVNKPKLVLLENVKGLVGHDGGKTLDTIVTTLNSIGYTVDFEVLNSKYFGVPQNRERIFIVGVLDGATEDWNVGKRTDVVAKGKRRIALLDGVKTFNFDWPSQEEVAVRLRDILENNVDERFYLSEDKTQGLIRQLTEKGIEVNEATKVGYKLAEPGDAVNVQFPNSNTRRGRVGKQIAQTLEASGINQGVVETKTGIEYSRKNGIGKERNTALCLSASDWCGLNRNQTQNAVIEVSVKSIGNTNPSGNGMNGQVYDIDAGLAPTLTTNKGEGSRITSAPTYRIRKLTPLECFRLQGFPDEFHEKLTAANVSNSQLYKMAGNAVTVNVIEAIGERLIPLLDEVDRT